ncbi:MAG: hypothetical protein R3236_00425, partial [Phycisphaeraceae bacterium]|nr:hypothetical protein [Phycisphaeraceae bacterium]
EATEATDQAIKAYRTLLKLKVPDRVRVHFRLARMLKTAEPTQARHHVLRALEEAPRFREAQNLLKELAKERGGTS